MDYLVNGFEYLNMSLLFWMFKIMIEIEVNCFLWFGIRNNNLLFIVESMFFMCLGYGYSRI